MAADRRRLLIRLIAAQASQGLVQLSVRQSTGANCAFCVDAIARGIRQYEIGVGLSTIIVDQKCYESSLQQILDNDPSIGDHA